MNIRIIRTDASNADFLGLVKLLDAELALRDGDDHAFYGPLNTIGMTLIKHAVVVYDGDQPVGCGAFKAFSAEAMEIKRMYTLPVYRGKGVATSVITELEYWIKELTFKKSVLETGKKQSEAIALYSKLGYRQIPNYGQYAGVENSVCMEKELQA